MTKDREAGIRNYMGKAFFADGCLSASDAMLFDTLAEIDRLRVALAGMVSRSSLCDEVLRGKPFGFFVSSDMEAVHCGKCPPCVAREALEQK